MKKFKKVLFVCVGIYIFTVLPLAQAQNALSPSAMPPKWHSGERIQEIYSQLNLTDDQKKELEANKQQHRARMQSARQEIKADKEALKEELMKPQLDMAKVHELHNQIKVLLSQMEDDKLNSILAVRTILTPEQFAKFVNLMHKHKQDHEGKTAE